MRPLPEASADFSLFFSGVGAAKPSLAVPRSAVPATTETEVCKNSRRLKLGGSPTIECPNGKRQDSKRRVTRLSPVGAGKASYSCSPGCPVEPMLSLGGTDDRWSEQDAQNPTQGLLSILLRTRVSKVLTSILAEFEHLASDRSRPAFAALVGLVRT